MFLRLNITPCPASRPRVGKWGTYYTTRYAQWRTDASELLDDADRVFRSPIRVAVLFAVPRSKSSKLIVPTGDGDNYEKAIYDLLQSKGYVEDDKLITSASWKKRFVAHGESGYIELSICLEEEDIDLT